MPARPILYNIRGTARRIKKMTTRTTRNKKNYTPTFNFTNTHWLIKLYEKNTKGYEGFTSHQEALRKEFLTLWNEAKEVYEAVGTLPDQVIRERTKEILRARDRFEYKVSKAIDKANEIMDQIAKEGRK